MPDDKKKNGSGDGRKAGMKRDGKGRFLPGHSGGPGRGNNRENKEMSEVVASIKSLSQNDDLNLLDSTVLDLVGRLVLYDGFKRY